MDRRSLGTSGLSIAPLVLGGNVFGWTVDEPRSFELLDAFVDAGFNCIDTADVYSVWKPGNQGGESETTIGRWLQRTGKREKVVIATKVGWQMGNGGKGLSRSYIMQAAEDSLKRLHTDYIDLYQSHLDDPDLPVDEPLSAYAKLVEQGKVRAIGASNFTAERLASALDAAREHSLPTYTCLQPLYNLYDREAYETALEGLCRKHGLGVIPYSSLRSGFLTGKYRSEADLSKSVRGARIKDYLNPRGFRILEALETVSTEMEVSLTSVALAWLLARPGITAPIASATSREQLAELVAAPRLKLAPNQVELLNRASSPA